MCIIMYAPQGSTIKDSKIRTAFKNNPDGAGIMWYDRGGNVRYKKGFDNVDNLILFFNLISKDVPRAIHCRIATSGKVSVGTCHPFPIVENVEEMREAEGVGKRGCLMHNGIFSKYTPKDGLKCEYSDTMFFTSRVVYPIVRSNCVDNKGVDELLRDMTSRVILFLPKFRVKRYGTWHKDEEEKFFASNYTYENYYSTYYGYGCYNYYNTDPYYRNYTNVHSKSNSNKTQITILNPQNKTTPTAPSTSKNTTTITQDGVTVHISSSHTPKGLADVKPKAKIIKPEYFFSIQLTAKDKKQAEDLLYEFLDNYYGFIADADDYDADAYLIPVDDVAGIWEFWVEAYEDLDKLEKIKPPFMINYFEKYTED